MSNKRITARNRSNARNSTGPKTASGKAIAAGNAKKHGVTGRPDPERVRTWLAVILGRPSVRPDDLMPDDDHGFLALALAEAEVRLVTVQDALCALDNEHPEVPKTMFGLYQASEEVMQLAEEMISYAAASPRGFQISLRIVDDKYGPRIDGLSLLGKRRKVLTRYLSEAKSRRRRLFTAWIAMEAAEKAHQQTFSPNKANTQPSAKRGGIEVMP